MARLEASCSRCYKTVKAYIVITLDNMNVCFDCVTNAIQATAKEREE